MCSYDETLKREGLHSEQLDAHVKDAVRRSRLNAAIESTLDEEGLHE